MTHIFILLQDARKIVGGVLQKITYCDWLPIILGPKLIQKFELGCEGRSHYHANVDPRVANVFLTGGSLHGVRYLRLYFFRPEGDSRQ